MSNRNELQDDLTKQREHDGQEKRHFPFEGIQNFRDMGGYKTDDGRHIKWGMLYRSGQLSELTPTDQMDFKNLGIELICDFRWEGEQHRAPTRIEDTKNLNLLNLPIKTGSFQSFFEKIGVETPGIDDMMTVMREIYRNFVHEHVHSYADMFENLQQTHRGTLIHCSAGKDRTGFGAAMILTALGVNRDTIMADYLLSAKYFSAESAMDSIRKHNADTKRFSFDVDVLRPVYEVYPDYLQTSFNEIESNFESMDQYLEQSLGLSPEVRKGLKDKYLE